MHCVDFFILDLLERYRQNTGKTHGGTLNLGLGVDLPWGVAPEKPLISEVNHLRAWVVLGWVTTWEVHVL